MENLLYNQIYSQIFLDILYIDPLLFFIDLTQNLQINIKFAKNRSNPKLTTSKKWQVLDIS